MIAAAIIGVILLVVGYNVDQPVPLNQLEVWGGWIALVIALVLLILHLTGRHRSRF